MLSACLCESFYPETKGECDIISVWIFRICSAFFFIEHNLHTLKCTAFTVEFDVSDYCVYFCANHPTEDLEHSHHPRNLILSSIQFPPFLLWEAAPIHSLWLCLSLEPQIVSLGCSAGKEPACRCRRYKRCEIWFWSLGWEKEMATHSSILAWKILWTEEPGGLQSMGSQSIGFQKSRTQLSD